MPLLGVLRWGLSGWVRAGGLVSRCVFKMDWRLGRGDGGGGFWVDFVAECVYPPRRVTVVRDRCSAGGGGGDDVFPGSGVRMGLCVCPLRGVWWWLFAWLWIFCEVHWGGEVPCVLDTKHVLRSLGDRPPWCWCFLVGSLG